MQVSAALFDTTAGRVMLGHVLPRKPKISYRPSTS